MRRGGRRIGGAVVDAGGAVVEAAGEAVGDVAMALVERVAPELVPIIRKGRWRGCATRWPRPSTASPELNRLDPSGTLAGMLELYTGLVSRAAGIVAALASGDCQPLLDAIGQLKSFVVEVAGEAWDHLSAFFAPVGAFFSDLWAGYGAPAVEWLQQFAGGVWERVQQFGTDIWNWTAPVRNAVGDAWGWVKEQLFGPDDAGSGESSGGIIGWVTTKAGEAWDWVKEQTRPVWQPISRAAERVAEMLPPPFVQGLGEQMQGLSAELETAEGAMEGGDAVAENRDTLASVLPSVSPSSAACAASSSALASGWRRRSAAFGAGVAGLMGALRGSSLLSALAGALSWLESAAERLIGWVQSGVGALFERVLSAFDALSPFIEAAAGVVRRLIGVVGNLLRLPQLILSTVWEAIPCCIREPIKNFMVEQILGRIPVFGQFFTDPTLWPRVQATAMRILRQVFVDGDIRARRGASSRRCWACSACRRNWWCRCCARRQAPSATSYQPDRLPDQPARCRARRLRRFFGNILTHLLGGVTGWLMGMCAMPESHRRTTSAALDPRFRARSAGRHRSASGQARAPASPPPWHGCARCWVADRRVALRRPARHAGARRAVGRDPEPARRPVADRDQRCHRLDQHARHRPCGALADEPAGRDRHHAGDHRLVAVYNAIESFVAILAADAGDRFARARRHPRIARAPSRAAGFLENALASSLPVAIGFLANQFGLGRLGERIRELLESVQRVVDRALDWLVDRAIRLGQGLIDMARRGASAVGGAVRCAMGWLAIASASAPPTAKATACTSAAKARPRC